MPLILIGRIGDAHGIRGAVKLFSFASNPADIARYGALQTADQRSFKITKMKPAKDHFIADLEGITNRNEAEALKGVELFVARDQLPKSDDTYLSDLEGKDVVAEGQTLGRIIGFQNYGAGELMELDNGELIPVAFIAKVDQSVLLDLPPGYLDPATHEDQHH